MYRPNVKKQAADPLSRLFANGKDTSPLENYIPLLSIDTHTAKNTSTNNHKVASPQSFQPLLLTKSLRAQASDAYCHMGHGQTGRNNSYINVNSDSLLLRCSRVYGALETVASQLLYQRIPLLSRHPPVAGHPGNHRI